MLILCKLGLFLQGWRRAREGVDSRRENWAGARTSELVPSVPGASGIMRSGSWFRVSLKGSAIWVDLPQAPKGGQGWRRAKCPALSQQRPDSASWDRKSLDLIKMGQAQEQRTRQRPIDRERCVCLCVVCICTCVVCTFVNTSFQWGRVSAC